MTPDNAVSAELLVVCLCAQWCGVCRDYRQRFESLQDRFPQVRFVWIDVEDEADLLDPLDVDDFPTLLLARGWQPRFFGVVRPQAEALERLLRSQFEAGSAAAVEAAADPATVALVKRIRLAQAG